MNGLEIIENRLHQEGLGNAGGGISAWLVPLASAAIGAGSAIAQQSSANKAQRESIAFQQQQLKVQESIALQQAEAQRASLEARRLELQSGGVNSTGIPTWVWVAGGVGVLAIAGLTTFLILKK